MRERRLGKRRRRFIWPALFIVSSLIAGLYSCSGISGSNSENNNPASSPLGKLYVSNSDGSVIAFDNALTVLDNIPPSRRFPEAITGPTGIFLDEANDTLYVANTDHNSILIYEHASTLNPPLGAALATHIISGTQTGLNKPFGIVYDPGRGRLYVANKENSVSVFQAGCAGATALDGNISPCQTLSGVATLLDFPRALALDAARDILYISNSGTNSILIYDNASASTLQGNLPPTRIIGPHSADSEIDSVMTLPFGVAVDSTNDRLYVVNTGRNRPAILIYDHASAQNGAPVPDRLLVDEVTETNGVVTIITSIKLSQPIGIFISVAQDRLFVVNGNNTNNGPAPVVVFNNITTRCTNQIHLCHLPPDQSLTGINTGMTNPAGIAYDQDNDLIYIGNTGANNILTFSLQGNLAPIKVNAGVNTTFANPISFFYDNSVYDHDSQGQELRLDRLYVLNEGAGSTAFQISVFENISSKPTFQNTAPDWGMIGGTTAQGNDIVQPRALYLDHTGHNLIILTVDKLLIYNLDQSGIPAAPTTRTTGSAITLPVNPTPFNGFQNGKSMTVDEKSGDIYIGSDCDAANAGDCAALQPNRNRIVVFHLNPKAAPATDAPTGALSRIIAGTNTGIDRPFGLFLDTQRDILYVTNVPHSGTSGPTANTVLSFDGASTLSGNIAPNRILSSGAGFSSAQKLSTPLAPFVDVAADRLFLLNKTQNTLFIFNHASTRNGDTLPDRTISGPDTQISLSMPNPISASETRELPAALFVDISRGPETIYVGQPKDPTCATNCSQNVQGALLVFGLQGNASPSRVWSGGETPVGGISALAVDTARDILYTANIGDPAITADDSLFAFSNVSAIEGSLGTHRSLCSPAGTPICPDTKFNNPGGLFIDSGTNRLYLSNSGTDCSDSATPCNAILVFYVASGLDHDAVPNQIITTSGSPAINNPHGLALDTQTKTLYVANTGGNSVLVFKNAEALNGTVTPDAEITGVQSQINQPVGVAIDPERNTLYVLNQGAPEILVFDAASTQNGNIPPSRVISGSGYMVKPSSLFLDTTNNLLYVADQGNNAVYVFYNASSAQGAAEHKNLIGNNTGLNQPTALYVDTTR